MGMLIFVLAELMLFGGLISAFTIVRASALTGWPPPGQPRLPVGETAFNSAALLLSGVLLFLAHRAYQREPSGARIPLLVSILLGGFFLVFQGFEWLSLIRDGLTLTSSSHGSFFYLIIGLHALHAMAALLLLVSIWIQLRGARLSPERFHAAQVFWYFVVGLWPVLYWRVYL